MRFRVQGSGFRNKQFLPELRLNRSDGGGSASGGFKPLRAGINLRPYDSASALLGGDKPPPLRMDLYLKVAAGLIPAQYHNRFQLQMAINAHPFPSGGGFTTFCDFELWKAVFGDMLGDWGGEPGSRKARKRSVEKRVAIVRA